jgi:hypothetical protein
MTGLTAKLQKVIAAEFSKEIGGQQHIHNLQIFEGQWGKCHFEFLCLRFLHGAIDIARIYTYLLNGQQKQSLQVLLCHPSSRFVFHVTVNLEINLGFQRVL